MLKFAILATVLTVFSVNAQIRTRDALITWYGGTSGNNTSSGSGGSCPSTGAPKTYVVAVQGICQRVPNTFANNLSFPGYKVTCDSANNGLIQYCEDICK